MQKSTTLLPFSLSQHQIWLDQQSHPESPHLNIGGAGFITGKIDVELLSKALFYLVDENEALRLLPLIDGRQVLVTDWQEPLLEFEDLSADPIVEQLIQSRWKNAFMQPFILDGQHRPWRITLTKSNEQRHGMMAQFHHLVMDGLSVSLLLQRLSVLYNQLATGQVIAKSTQGDYQQFITESNQYLHCDKYHTDANYWQSILSTLPPPILEKHSHGFASTSLPPANHYVYKVPPDEYQQLKQFAQTQKTTMYHLFVAALAIYFCRSQGKTEVVLGMPILNRTGNRYKKHLGMFAVVIPLRVDISKHNTVVDLLQQISLSLRGAYRHSRYPLSKLSNDLNLIHSGQDHLVDLILSFEVQDFNVHFGEGSLHKIQRLFSEVARYPLLVSVCEFHCDEPTEIILESSADYFNAEQTNEIAHRLHYLMMKMISSPDARIDQLPLLQKEERYELIVGKHADIPHHPDPQPFITPFEHQAALRPLAIAIRWQQLSSISDGYKHRTLSYQQVNQQANRLAHKLIETGVNKGDIVAVVLPRQPQTIIAFLAIAKAGAAFVPLNTDAPIARLEQLIKISGAVLTLIGQSTGSLNHNTLLIEGQSAPQNSQELPAHNPNISLNAQDLAYLLFTSGSTGTPKGVLMRHAALTRRLAWLARTFNYTPKDVSLQSIQLTFDPAMIEIFLPLTQGASIALVPPGQLAPSEMAHQAELFGATSIIFVPTTLRYFNLTAKNHPNLKLRVAISGGELLHQSMANQFVQHTGARLFNLYGPTEACIFATAHQFNVKTSGDPVPIGEPVDDTRIYIVDKNLQPLPIGITGEILIGGDALANGYLNNPDANQKFIDDPFLAGARVFRTGDNGYWDTNKQLQFVGRIDNQLKLRGQRIEPGEIETALCEISGIFAAAVKKSGDSLHAWVVLDKAQDISLCSKLGAILKQKLPAYMIPEDFTPIAAIPHQISGKTDYKALICPSPTSDKSVELVISPSTDLQRLLLNLFQEVLETDKLGINFDFFKAGGNSLTALNLLGKINQQTGQKIPLSILLKNPTVGALATALIQRNQPLLVNLSEHQSGAPIYLAASGHGDALRLSPLAHALGRQFNLQMLQPPSPDGCTSYKTIFELAEYYACLIEQRHHNTPPILAGFSIGGITAIETARRLVVRGIPIGGLVLIDTAYPGWFVSRTPIWPLCGWLVRSLRLQELSINQRTLGSLFSDQGLNGQITALKSYHPEPFSLPTTLIISSGFSRWHRLLYRPWRKLLKANLTEQHLPGFHGTLFAPEHVDALAQIIRDKNRDSQV